MSSQTTTPAVPVDEPYAVETSTTPPGAGPEPAVNGDEPPFESPEFGVGGFFPHLDAESDG